MSLNVICLSHPETIPHPALPWKVLPASKKVGDCCLELIQWAAPQEGGLGRRDYKGEKYSLVSKAGCVLCIRGADLLCGISKGSTLASDGTSRKYNLGFNIRKHFLPKLSQDSIGCLRRWLKWVTWVSDPQDPFWAWELGFITMIWLGRGVQRKC